MEMMSAAIPLFDFMLAPFVILYAFAPHQLLQIQFCIQIHGSIFAESLCQGNNPPEMLRGIVYLYRRLVFPEFNVCQNAGITDACIKRVGKTTPGVICTLLSVF